MIALVVTIIVLLILAAVAINLTIGDNGIITRAQQAVDLYTNKAKQEEEMMNNFENGNQDKMLKTYVNDNGIINITKDGKLKIYTGLTPEVKDEQLEFITEDYAYIKNKDKYYIPRMGKVYNNVIYIPYNQDLIAITENNELVVCVEGSEHYISNEEKWVNFEFDYINGDEYPIVTDNNNQQYLIDFTEDYNIINIKEMFNVLKDYEIKSIIDKQTVLTMDGKIICVGDDNLQIYEVPFDKEIDKIIGNILYTKDGEYYFYLKTDIREAEFEKIEDYFDELNGKNIKEVVSGYITTEDGETYSYDGYEHTPDHSLFYTIINIKEKYPQLKNEKIKDCREGYILIEDGTLYRENAYDLSIESTSNIAKITDTGILIDKDGNYLSYNQREGLYYLNHETEIQLPFNNIKDINLQLLLLDNGNLYSTMSGTHIAENVKKIKGSSYIDESGNLYSDEGGLLVSNEINIKDFNEVAIVTESGELQLLLGNIQGIQDVVKGKKFKSLTSICEKNDQNIYFYALEDNGDVYIIEENEENIDVRNLSEELNLIDTDITMVTNKFGLLDSNGKVYIPKYDYDGNISSVKCWSEDENSNLYNKKISQFSFGTYNVAGYTISCISYIDEKGFVGNDLQNYSIPVS